MTNKIAKKLAAINSQTALIHKLSTKLARIERERLDVVQAIARAVDARRAMMEVE